MIGILLRHSRDMADFGCPDWGWYLDLWSELRRAWACRHYRARPAAAHDWPAWVKFEARP